MKDQKGAGAKKLLLRLRPVSELSQAHKKRGAISRLLFFMSLTQLNLYTPRFLKLLFKANGQRQMSRIAMLKMSAIKAKVYGGMP